MTTRTLSTTAGLGGENPDLPNGNVVETVTADQDTAGTWTVTHTTWDADGTPTATTRQPTDGELERLNPTPAPEVNPAVAALLESLSQVQRDALALALAAFPPA